MGRLMVRDESISVVWMVGIGEAANNLALVLVNRGRTDEAIRLLQVFIEKNPGREHVPHAGEDLPGHGSPARWAGSRRATLDSVSRPNYKSIWPKMGRIWK